MNLVGTHKPIVIFGAGAFFIDRYTRGEASGAERYLGDTVAGSISATVERTTVYSGDGAVATKLVDRVRQIDRTLSVTPQDATLDNMALFLMASRPAAVAAQNQGTKTTTWDIPADVTDRDYFQFRTAGTALAAQTSFTVAADATFTFVPALASGDTNTPPDYEFDRDTGRLRLMAGGIKKAAGKTLRLTINKVASAAFERVEVGSDVSPVYCAVRYIEHGVEGEEGRNLYIPRASVAPNGEVALKGRDTPQQFPLTLSIEEPGDGLAQIYIDGVPV